MRLADYECKTCSHKWEFKAEYGQDFPVHPECPECGSVDTTRYWTAATVPACEVAEGKTGNARNGYKSNVLYKGANATPLKNFKHKVDGAGWDG